MSDLYHGEYPTDMTPAEAQCEVKHTLAEQQRLNDAVQAEMARVTAALEMAAFMLEEIRKGASYEDAYKDARKLYYTQLRGAA